MNEEEKVEQFRAELYMRTMEELIPKLEAAIEQTVTVHLAAQDAMRQLGRVKTELNRLERLTEDESETAIKRLRKEITIHDMIDRYESESFVYFIEAGDYIKIGYSRDPMARLSQIRNGRGMTIPDGLDTSKARILAVEQGGMSDEKRLHRRFADRRVAGEWFEKHDRLAHYVQSLSTPA